MKPKSTSELFDEAAARRGWKRIPLGDSPAKQKAKPRPSKAKHGDNGSKAK